jgi:hypothetical protein
MFSSIAIDSALYLFGLRHFAYWKSENRQLALQFFERPVSSPERCEHNKESHAIMRAKKTKAYAPNRLEDSASREL